MEKQKKISTGANARPRNESISQTAGGLPDDSGHAPDVDDVKIERVRARLTKNRYHGRDLPGAAGESSAGAEEDTYD